ncbi:MAG: M20/M25/M40 family metallo-hydrolase [Acidobacteriota bacterium]
MNWRSGVRVAVIAMILVSPVLAEERVDLEMISRIKAEGFRNSQVMETLSYLTDVSGPRLTGSPGFKAAAEWSRDRLKKWGLVGAKLEPWGVFGRGWELRKFSIDMVQPYYSPLIGYPKAWTPGTEGVIHGRPLLFDVKADADLEQYKGKLKGAIVLVPLRREVEPRFKADARRRTDEDLGELAMAPEPGARSAFAARRAEFRKRRAFRKKINDFLRQEGAALILEPSRGEDGTVFVSRGGSQKPDEDPVLPSVVVAVEHHSRLVRLLDKGVPVELEIDVRTQFYDEDQQGYNVVAEILGTDPMLKEELVMLGGHLDSWHAATGTTDNAAGVSVAMEAVRILEALHIQPRRTIRIALWSGEEQGLLGSRAYVKNHFADPKTMELQPDHEKLSAYFNLDNGTGKIRGVYLQGNDAARPIFKAYLEPFQDLGASTLTIRNTGGTDHLAFDAVGLPGFQFIQDWIDYSTRTHHSNMDFYDHAVAGDLMQASAIMASFVYHTAMRDEKLPRKPLPQPEKPAKEEGEPTHPTGGR